jgi:hypothetical protein
VSETKGIISHLRLSGVIIPLVLATRPTLAGSIVNCGGAALLGGAQLICSHIVATAPPQLCTFSWALATADNQTRVISGSFLIQPGVANLQVYQGAGFAHAMSEPIILCQGKRRAP